jgi:hypothetical protein
MMISTQTTQYEILFYCFTKCIMFFINGNHTYQLLQDTITINTSCMILYCHLFQSKVPPKMFKNLTMPDGTHVV